MPLLSLNMLSSTTHGYLEIILGSMYAGKTSRLVELHKQCKLCHIPNVVINHSIDTRFESVTETETETDNTQMFTHDLCAVDCIKCDRLMLLIDNDAVLNSNVVLINEGQFFEDLVEFVTHMLKLNKQIYVCGLDGDFERKRFGHILDLIPLCDKVTKLTSLCLLCKDGTPGIFSKRLTSNTEQTVVGGNDVYIPVCRRCFDR